MPDTELREALIRNYIRGHYDVSNLSGPWWRIARREAEREVDAGWRGN